MEEKQKIEAIKEILNGTTYHEIEEILLSVKTSAEHNSTFRVAKEISSCMNFQPLSKYQTAEEVQKEIDSDINKKQLYDINYEAFLFYRFLEEKNSERSNDIMKSLIEDVTTSDEWLDFKTSLHFEMYFNAILTPKEVKLKEALYILKDTIQKYDGKNNRHKTK